jgi:hypothetical protein
MAVLALFQAIKPPFEVMRNSALAPWPKKSRRVEGKGAPFPGACLTVARIAFFAMG